jgi:hypothetical protein
VAWRSGHRIRLELQTRVRFPHCFCVEKDKLRHWANLKKIKIISDKKQHSAAIARPPLLLLSRHFVQVQRREVSNPSLANCSPSSLPQLERVDVEQLKQGCQIFLGT